ncbi:ATP-binding protein [Sporosarcina sp. G11-34]|uniref:ATP-binding protein n=1 Tax=Sporosarcina sp. G11-34 TaxID=2849605 RepID=UPI0022A9F522|nr:ATP-binding protein [Sporosarcina sp. G11-34]MCZ2258624.1 ATP-binding protein [Sporosarcina sp. G11-34]
MRRGRSLAPRSETTYVPRSWRLKTRQQSISLIGGGTFPKPGEISLAHNGVLFLDELGEFSRKTLDMLRQPLESGEVTISRVKQTVTYPSTFILIAATNPCPCGYFGSNERYCTCTPKQVTNYQHRASGLLLDRLDFILSLKNVGLQQDKTSESSAEIRIRTTRAREMQRDRYGNEELNGTVAFQILHETCGLSNKQANLIEQTCFEQKWSNRTQVKLIRLARTISDLEGEHSITDLALQEAIDWKRSPSLLPQSPMPGGR